MQLKDMTGIGTFGMKGKFGRDGGIEEPYGGPSLSWRATWMLPREQICFNLVSRTLFPGLGKQGKAPWGRGWIWLSNMKSGQHRGKTSTHYACARLSISGHFRSLFQSHLSIVSPALILVPRARRFLVTWLGNRLQIKPSGSGDKNAARSASCCLQLVVQLVVQLFCFMLLVFLTIL